MNDPRITSYAVGELDAPDREIFEKELAASAELQAELKEIIALAEQLPSSFGPSEGLTDEQRENLRTQCADNRRALRREASRRRTMISGIAALAAGLTATAIVLSNRQETQPAQLGKIAAVTPDKPAASAKPAATPTPVTTPLIAADRTASPAAPSVKTQTDRLLAEGEAFLKSSSFDLAQKRYEQVLNLDEHNIAARKGFEAAAKADASYAAAAQNQSRAHMLWAVNEEWEMPVRKFTGGQNTIGTGLLAKAEAKSAKESNIAPGKPIEGTNYYDRSEIAGSVTLEAGEVPPPAQSLLAAAPLTVSGAVASGSGNLQGGAGSTRSITLNGTLAQNQSGATGVMFGSSTGSDSMRRESRAKLRTDIIDEIDLPPSPVADPGNESYASKEANPFLDAKANPLSTFSIDVDTASYANVRRFLTDGNLPPPDAVRIEELVNYFPYDYPQPEGDTPFSVNTEVSQAPWDSDMLLARVALKGRDIAPDKLPPSNLVFLVDVSGSMQPDNKLPLLKRSLLELVKKISPQDQVAIVTYAGESGVALGSTSGENKTRIQRAIKRLSAGGSTNGASGIQLAYDMAREHFIKGGNNRIILCTDGDFNVGITSMDALTQLIERERKSNIFLSVLGFGTGNLKDATMENLADKGNGNYAYIDTSAEGRKVLVDQMRANLFTIAKDVKIQVEFNPAKIAGYRLIGYENRMLAKEDFNNDKKDAGEIGAGHTVTALYELVPAGKPFPSSVDPLKYQTPAAESENPKSKIQNPKSKDLFTVKLRYKAQDGDKSKLIEKIVGPETREFDKASQDFRFATAVAAFGLKLRGGTDDPDLDWNEIQSIARGSLGEDPDAYRAEFLTLVQKAKKLSRDDEDE